jgi:hypothetical protein
LESAVFVVINRDDVKYNVPSDWLLESETDRDNLKSGLRVAEERGAGRHKIAQHLALV